MTKISKELENRLEGSKVSVEHKGPHILITLSFEKLSVFARFKFDRDNFNPTAETFDMLADRVRTRIAEYH